MGMVVVGLAVALVGSMAWAQDEQPARGERPQRQPGQGGMRPGMGGMGMGAQQMDMEQLHKVLLQLDLTEEQTDKIKTLE